MRDNIKLVLLVLLAVWLSCLLAIFSVGDLVYSIAIVTAISIFTVTAMLVMRRCSMGTPFALSYFSFPYSQDPEKWTRIVGGIAREVCKNDWNVIPLVPHFMFDALYGFPHGYTHPEFSDWELEIIALCDRFYYSPQCMSAGVRWELAFARRLDKTVISLDDVFVER